MQTSTAAMPLSEFDKSRFKSRVTFILNHRNLSTSMVRVVKTGNKISDGQVPVQFPNLYTIASEFIVFDKTTNKQRIIRYALGEKTMWKDDQSDDTKIPKKRQVIEFSQGQLYVEPTQTILLEVLRMHPNNGSNTNRDITKPIIFYEYNPAAGAKNLIEKDKVEFKAKEWCYKEDWESLRSYAMVLGVDIDRDPAEVRYELGVYASRDPRKFLDGLKNDSTQRKYYVMEAINLGILTQDKRQNTISWTNGNVICQAPMGKDAVDHVVGLTFNDQRGQVLFETIKDSVTPEIKNSPEIHEDKEKYKLQFDSDEAEKVIEQALECGVFTKSGQWIKYKDGHNWIGKAAIRALSNDNLLMEEVKAIIKSKTKPSNTEV